MVYQNRVRILGSKDKIAPTKCTSVHSSSWLSGAKTTQVFPVNSCAAKRWDGAGFTFGYLQIGWNQLIWKKDKSQRHSTASPCTNFVGKIKRYLNNSYLSILVEQMRLFKKGWLFTFSFRFLSECSELGRKYLLFLLDVLVVTRVILTNPFSQANQVGEKEMAEFCLSQIDNHSVQVLSSNQWVTDADGFILRQILVRDGLQIKETDLYLAVHRWEYTAKEVGTGNR